MNMNPTRRMALACLVLMLSALGVGNVRANSFQPGQTFSGILQIAGKQIPLPDGVWHVAGYSREAVKSSIDFGPYGIIHDLILFRTGGDPVSAFMHVHANALSVNDGWGISRDCQRRDGYATAIRYQSGWDVSCVFLVHTQSASTDASSHAWRDALVYAREKNMEIPPTWITTGFRVANRRDILDVRIAFNPLVQGLPADIAGSWADSPWHATRVETDNTRSPFLRDLGIWTLGYAALIEDGIKNRLENLLPYTMPFGEWDTDGAKSVIATDRLKVLDRLRAEGLVGETDYEAQRERILSGRSQEPIPQPDASTIALWKTISDRPLVSFANVFIDYYWVGSPFAAGVLVALQIVVNTTKFYFHEIAWERYFGGAVGKRDAPRVVDFSYAGVSE
jgi:uncharacterized membrane protein